MAFDEKQQQQQQQQQLRPHAQFAVGSDIEVTSNEEGFRGIWFPAKIVSPPSTTSTNMCLVEYKTLVRDDNGSDPLTELADLSLLRPALMTKEKDEGSLEVSDVVEAYHNDGWWVGVVVAVLGQRTYRVFFNNPPDEVQVDRSSLRLHKDWVDGKWIRPPKQDIALILNTQKASNPNLTDNGKVNLLPENSGGINGSAEDLRNGQEESVVPSRRSLFDNRTTPVRIEQATINKTCKKLNEKSLPDLKSPQASETKATMPEDLNDKSPASLEIPAPDMEDNSSVGKSSSSGGKMEALDEKVDSSTNKRASSKKWRGKKRRRKGKLEIRTPRTSSAGKATLKKKNATDHVNDGTCVDLANEREHGKEDLTDEGTSPKRKRGTPHDSLTAQDKSNVDSTKEPLQSTDGNETLRKSRRQKKSVYESAVLALKPTRKKPRMTTVTLSTQECQVSPKCKAESEPISNGDAGDIYDDEKSLSSRRADSHSLLIVDSTQSEGGTPVPYETIEHNDTSTQGNNVDIAENATKTLPFTKTSAIWKVVEAMEVFQQIPQNPHFQALHESKEDCREGLAIGCMVTFSGLVEKISKFGFVDSKNVLDDSLDTLSDLERHGFNVHSVKARLKELISIKSRHEDSQILCEDVKNQIEERQSKKKVIVKEINEIEKMIAELRTKRELAVSRVKIHEGEIDELESRMESVKGGLDAGQAEFERLVTAPW